MDNSKSNTEEPKRRRIAKPRKRKGLPSDKYDQNRYWEQCVNSK